VSGWVRAALWCAALAVAVTVFPSRAADQQPPILRQSPLLSPTEQDAGLNPANARAAIDYVYLCADCHGGIGEGNLARGVPPLAGRSARDLQQRLAQLRMAQGRAGRPDHTRVLSKLNQGDMDAIANYLSTLVPPPAIATH
jgi:cytochrome c553